ncbi:MAG: sigma-70 family RNA polymerase sigma factor [Rhizomicrobium sp.]
MLAAEAQLKALMLSALAGDAAAYRALLAILSAQLRRYYARRLASADATSAEDLVQETLIAVHTRRATYDTSLPFTPWLYAVARYKLMDHLRRGRIRATVALDDAGDLFAEDESEAALARRDLDRLLETLPQATRDAIRQVKIEGLSTAEAAERSGRSEIAVRVGIHRGLKALGEKLREGRSREDR